ncbi:hypothetical protein D3C72_2451120 [compost metagenome]
MVLYVEPVADLLAVAIDGQRLSGQRVVDDQWNQFLGEMVWSVVVRAIRGEHG